MKTIKHILFALFIFTTASLVAGNPVNNPNAMLREEMQKLIKKVSWNSADKGPLKIQFLINSQNEIVIISTSNEAYDYEIKSHLNYQKIVVDKIEKNVVYTLPILII